MSLSARGRVLHMSAMLRSSYPKQFGLASIQIPAFSRQFGTTSGRGISTSSLPTTLQPSFWRSLVPKFWRSDSEGQVAKKTKDGSKEWNPATFFIMIFLLIGSQGIQMVSLQSNFDRFSTQTETKLALLREVVRRVQNGEDVDVEGMMGTGDPTKEKEWEDVMRELEQEDNRIRKQRRRRKTAQKQDEQAPDSSTPSPAPG